MSSCSRGMNDYHTLTLYHDSPTGNVTLPTIFHSYIPKLPVVEIPWIKRTHGIYTLQTSMLFGMYYLICLFWEKTPAILTGWNRSHEKCGNQENSGGGLQVGSSDVYTWKIKFTGNGRAQIEGRC